MSETRKCDFHVGQLEDGRFAAASIVAPFFCFIGETEDAVIAKANGALDFFFSHEGTVTQRRGTTNKVVNFVPQRRVETTKEYACA